VLLILAIICQIPATTAEGKAVILNEDGSWEYAQKTQPKAGDWEVSVDVSPMDDSKTVFLQLKAERPVLTSIGQQHTPYMILRCKEGSITAYVGTGSSAAGDDTAVTVRYDQFTAYDQEWSNSNSGDALFAPSAKLFIGKLLSHNRLTMRWTPFGSSPQVTTFSLTGLDSVIEQLGTACGWEPRASWSPESPEEDSVASKLRKMFLMDRIEDIPEGIRLSDIVSSDFALKSMVSQVSDVLKGQQWRVHFYLRPSDMYPADRMKSDAQKYLEESGLDFSIKVAPQEKWFKFSEATCSPVR